MPWTPASPAARWRLFGTVLLSLALIVPGGVARAQAAVSGAAPGVDDWIAEAAQRFALPPGWIRSVMRAESAFDPQVVSRAGAIGLMQLMPKTYAELRARYGLGADPFHPRDNILAGAAYLREMYDRFGARGFLAAYNAGPARYEQHLIEARVLPAETQAYVAALGPTIAGTATAGSGVAHRTRPVASLFAPIGGATAAATAMDPTPATPRDSLFATLTPRRERR